MLNAGVKITLLILTSEKREKGKKEETGRKHYSVRSKLPVKQHSDMVFAAGKGANITVSLFCLPPPTHTHKKKKYTRLF